MSKQEQLIVSHQRSRQGGAGTWHGIYKTFCYARHMEETPFSIRSLEKVPLAEVQSVLRGLLITQTFEIAILQSFSVASGQ
jgi:hypothetical protein